MPTTDEIVREQRADAFVSRVRKAVLFPNMKRDKDVKQLFSRYKGKFLIDRHTGLLEYCHKGRSRIPPSLWSQTMFLFHENQPSGHLDVSKTLKIMIPRCFGHKWRKK